jgi:hypothetical protein
MTTNTFRFRAALALALVVVLSTAVSLTLVSTSSGGESDELSLPGVPARDLADANIVLSNPRESPAITAEDAKPIARKGFHGEVKDVVLAHMKAEARSFEGLVWIVTRDPLTMAPIPADTDYVLYYFSVVDARTGKYLFGKGAGDTCERAYLYPDYAHVTEPICSGAVKFE